jgi:hypothetical protein
MSYEYLKKGYKFVVCLIYIIFADALYHAALYTLCLFFFFVLYYFLVCNQKEKNTEFDDEIYNYPIE